MVLRSTIKNDFESAILYVSDLLFTLNNTESFDVNAHTYIGGVLCQIFCDTLGSFHSPRSQTNLTQNAPLYMYVWWINEFLFCDI